MDELIFAGNKYISSKRASKLTGYTTDYIGQMCREDKMNCRLVGRNWYVNDIAIREQKKSFKKEQLNIDKKAIEYKKLDLEPMYYSDDARNNNPEIKKSLVEIEDIEPIVEKVLQGHDGEVVEIKTKEVAVKKNNVNSMSVLNIVESPVIDLRNIKRDIIKKPLREIIKRKILLPQKSSIRLPMLRILASIVILTGILFIAGTFALEKTVHYTSSDKSLDTEYQLANISKLFNF